ncbi:hypothetical protein GO755_29515 [Spirosoma sp. HMF4905]|uniref:Uncharacterized protein n=1 Tax=Spirosoma arboris TaxID=2682092 RepID=A0A7K1SKU7_9BACT|nr:hypothetical protein [Spirosoma arboris]MVM34206.1 hypothetical protein [Spirosoma arboris]
MKNIFTVILFSLSFYALGQDKIEGIGPFKIGQSNIKIIENIASELNIKVIRSNKSSDLDYPHSKSLIVEIETNLENAKGISEKASHCPFVIVYYISKYQVSGIELQSLFLTFRDEVLIKLETEWYFEIAKAIETKYGPGFKETRRIESDCPTSDNNSSYIGVQRLVTWRNNDILAATYTSVVYDKACHINTSRGFFIEQPSKAIGLNLCERQGWLKAEAIKTKKEKESLKDF